MEYIKRKINYKKSNKYLRSNNKDRNLELIKAWFEKHGRDNNSIDDCTWNDLNMDMLYERIDHTNTTPGEQLLYQMLRKPCFDKDLLNNREKILEYYKDNDVDRKALEKEFTKIDTMRWSLTELIDEPLKNSFIYKLIYNSATLLFIASVLLLILFRQQITIYLFMMSMSLNLYLHYNLDKKFTAQVESVLYLGKIINTSKKFIKYTLNSPFDIERRFEYLGNKLRKIGKNTASISRLEGIDILGDYINIIFLVKERKFFKISDEVLKLKNEICEYYELVGVLDALLSVLSYRENIDYFTIPEITDEKFNLSGSDVLHPLLNKPVGNHFNFNSKGAVITGSNMSGKSTFLRTIGLNVVMAQTIHTCLAKKFGTSFYKIVSSISLSDDIHNGKSYYLSEAEAIKRIVEDAKGELTTLSLVDEIFKGTNPVERISAATEILNYIKKENVVSLVTTHDMNLLPLIPSYDRYFFTEKVDDNKLEFDYKIRKGVSPNGNATRILEILGYPKEIIENIYAQIENLSKVDIS